jgi:hypothetical protein
VSRAARFRSVTGSGRIVIAGLDPAIHLFGESTDAGSSPGMTAVDRSEPIKL